MSRLRWGVLALMAAGVLVAQPLNQASQYDEADEVALREYVDVRIDALDRSVQAALESAEQAVLKAEAAANDRFESVNEFRKSIDDLGRLQMPRQEAEQAIETLNDRIDALTIIVQARETRGQGLSQGWVIAVGVLGFIGTVFSLFVMLKRKEGTSTR